MNTFVPEKGLIEDIPVGLEDVEAGDVMSLH